MGYECGFSIVKKTELEKLKNAEYIGDSCLSYWCSAGRTYLDEYFTNRLTETEKDSEIYFGITEDFIHQAMQWCDSEFDTCDLKEVVPTKSISVVDDESELIKRIDGVVVEDNDGKAIQIYEDGLYLCEDIDKHWCFTRLMFCLQTIETILKLGEYEVYFWRSY